MKTKTILLLINIFSIIGASIWLYSDRGWEQILTLLGLIGALIAQIFSGNNDNENRMMMQKGGKNSNNYQSKGDININNK